MKGIIVRPVVRNSLIIATTSLVLLAALLLFNTARQGSRQLQVAPVEAIALNAAAAAERLAGAVRIPTITYDTPTQTSAAEFLKFHAYLAQQFPTAHRVLRREVVNQYSLLYTWPGSDPAAKPVLLMAHQDVVPIAPGTEKDWQHAPFGGAVQDGFIWGRGAWDDKGNLMAMLEAVEWMVSKGVQPRQTIYLAFGHDEEAGTRSGEDGARAIAALLRGRGVKLDFVLNEGLLVTQGIMKGLDGPVALVGIAEKGYMTLEIHAHAAPGHSSMPHERTAIGSLATALTRLEHQQIPATIRDAAAEMFATVAPEFSGINRVLLSNLWLFEPLVRWQLVRQPSAHAMLRTTTAPTVVHAGNKEQVLPGQANALVNFRLMPGDTQQAVTRHAEHAIADDAIQVSGKGWEASPVSRTDSAAYRAINRSIREVFPTAVVAPGLMVGATDSRYLEDLTDNIYRFSPVRAESQDLARFHGTDERVSVANYAEMIRFYQRLLANVAAVDYAK
ncbi:MAG: M20 family peptidase [Pseudomonadota bacterium]